jgi:putative transposase
MKRSKFTDEQIVAVVKEDEAGRKVADLCRTQGLCAAALTRPSVFWTQPLRTVEE